MSGEDEWISLSAAHELAVALFKSKKTAELLLFNSFIENKVEIRGNYYLGNKIYSDTKLTSDRGFKMEGIIWDESRVEFRIERIHAFSGPPDYTHLGDFHQVEVKLADLYKIWPKLKTEQKAGNPIKSSAETTLALKGSGGAPPKIDWERCLIEAARWMYANQCPSHQAELVRYIAEWLGPSAPSDTQLKAHLAPLYRAFRDADRER